jgi:GTP pyrophosphokinase
VNFARTGRALQKIRRHLRQQELEQAVRLGREMVEAELKRNAWTMSKVLKQGRVRDTLKKRGHKDLDHLLVEVARGHLTPTSIAADLLPEGIWHPRSEDQAAGPLQAILSRFRRASQSPVLITGEDGLLVQFARCCSPLPGEPVVGFITRGRGITVHRTGCAQLSGMDPERQLAVEWDQSGESRHSGEIRIFCADRPGMLAHITKLCEQNGVNIQRAEARAGGADASAAVVTLALELRDVGELNRLIANMEKLPGVNAVHRTAG